MSPSASHCTHKEQCAGTNTSGIKESCGLLFESGNIIILTDLSKYVWFKKRDWSILSTQFSDPNRLMCQVWGETATFTAISAVFPARLTCGMY